MSQEKDTTSFSEVDKLICRELYRGAKSAMELKRILGLNLFDVINSIEKLKREGFVRQNILPNQNLRWILTNKSKIEMAGQNG